MKIRLIFALIKIAFVLNISYVNALSLTEEAASYKDSYFNNISAKEAYNIGNRLHAVYKDRESIKYLYYSAKRGDAQGAYLYAVVLDNIGNSRRDKDTIKKYMVTAADKGVFKAIRYLALREDFLPWSTRSIWMEVYYDRIIEIQQNNPQKAELELYLYHLRLNKPLAMTHLDKAIKLNNPTALILNADNIKSGQGFFFFNSSRHEASMHQYELAAQTNYIPAIRKYIIELYRTNLKEKAFEWHLKAASLGDLSSIAVVARVYAGYGKAYKSVGIDLLKAKLYYDTYLETVGRDFYEKLYIELADEQSLIISRMNNKELQAARAGTDEMLLKLSDKFVGDTYWTENSYFYNYLLNQ